MGRRVHECFGINADCGTTAPGKPELNIDRLAMHALLAFERNRDVPNLSLTASLLGTRGVEAEVAWRRVLLEPVEDRDRSSWNSPEPVIPSGVLRETEPAF